MRASFLDHACAGNPVLRARVEELLGAAAAAGFLPDQPQHRVRVEPQPTMPMEPGECLGEWVGATSSSKSWGIEAAFASIPGPAGGAGAAPGGAEGHQAGHGHPPGWCAVRSRGARRWP